MKSFDTLFKNDSIIFFPGVTTVVDGGRAGSMTFQGLRKFICEPSKTLSNP